MLNLFESIQAFNYQPKMFIIIAFNRYIIIPFNSLKIYNLNVVSNA